MATKAKAQLASIRKEAHRIEAQRMREHVRAKRIRLKHLQSEERSWTSARRGERRARLTAMRRNLRGIRRSEMAIRRDRLSALSQKRKQFTEWWAEVRTERARRLAEIAKLRQELKDWRALGPSRQDEYDLKTWGTNRRRERQPSTSRQTKPRGEARSELASNVELNLETPEELAWWRHGKAMILRNAKALGLAEGDQIAEWIRERIEEEPDRATEYLQADADAWLTAELRKQGFAV